MFCENQMYCVCIWISGSYLTHLQSTYSHSICPVCLDVAVCPYHSHQLPYACSSKEEIIHVQLLWESMRKRGADFVVDKKKTRAYTIHLQNCYVVVQSFVYTVICKSKFFFRFVFLDATTKHNMWVWICILHNTHRASPKYKNSVFIFFYYYIY